MDNTCKGILRHVSWLKLRLQLTRPLVSFQVDQQNLEPPVTDLKYKDILTGANMHKAQPIKHLFMHRM